jgi:hypothetical protein
MKANLAISIVGSILFAAPLFGPVYAQCTDALSPEEIRQGYKFEDKKILNDEDKKKELSRTERQFSVAKVTLTPDMRFKVALDSEVSSSFAKFNDQIPFTVLQNVYANVTLPGLDGKDVEKRCVVIPKGTKIYGVVDKAKAAYPLYLRGKSRLAVLVQQLELDSNESIVGNDRIERRSDVAEKRTNPIEISFVEPKIEGSLRNKNQKLLVRGCRIHEGGLCIVGRRPKLALPSNLLSPVAEGYLFAQSDNGTDVLGWVTGLKAFGGLTGLTDLVNPPKASLSTGMVFDVKVTRDQSIWISVAGSAKKDEGK